MKANGLGGSLCQIPSLPFEDAKLVVRKLFVNIWYHILIFSFIFCNDKMNTAHLQMTEISPPKINVIGALQLEHSLIFNVMSTNILNILQYFQ